MYHLQFTLPFTIYTADVHDHFSIPKLRDHINKLNENFQIPLKNTTIFKPFLGFTFNLQRLTLYNPKRTSSNTSLLRPYSRLEAATEDPQEPHIPTPSSASK